MALVLKIIDDGQPEEVQPFGPIAAVIGLAALTTILMNGDKVAEMVSAMRKPDRIEYENA